MDKAKGKAREAYGAAHGAEQTKAEGRAEQTKAEAAEEAKQRRRLGRPRQCRLRRNATSRAQG
jgi:hypothetical protein